MGETIQSVGQVLGWVLLSLVPIGALGVGASVIAESLSDNKVKVTAKILPILLVAVVICLSAITAKIYQISLSACDRAFLRGYEKGQRDLLIERK